MSLGFQIGKIALGVQRKGYNLLGQGLELMKGFLEEVVLELNLEVWLEIISKRREPYVLRRNQGCYI